MQDDVSMFVFLPDDVTQNMTLVEESLTAEFVQDLSMTLHPVHVALTLPVLKFSYSTDLLPLLTDLGEFLHLPPSLFLSLPLGLHFALLLPSHLSYPLSPSLQVSTNFWQTRT